MRSMSEASANLTDEPVDRHGVSGLERSYPRGRHANGRPFGMPRKNYTLLLDRSRFAEFLAEQTTPEFDVLTFICAQVASGVSLKVLSEHYVVDYGLLWAWLTDETERLERYELAQRGVAEYYVSEAPEIADDVEGDVARDKLRIDTRFRVAKSWNKARYGETPGLAINVGANSLVAILQGLPSAQVEAERQERLTAPELTENEPLDVVPTIASEKIPTEIPKNIVQPDDDPDVI